MSRRDKSLSLSKGVRNVEQILPFISEVGFPVVVTFYLLYRIETKLEAVIQSIQSLPGRMERVK
nr:YvrJ family protein [Lederbergia lenta]